MPILSNAKRERFCQEYLVDLNATQAAIRAGYGEAGAATQGWRLLRDVEETADRISELKAETVEKLELKRDRVIEELLRVAFANIADLIHWDSEGVHILPSKRLPRQVTAAVQEITFTKGKYQQRVSVKLGSKLDALDKLARHLGLLEGEGDDRTAQEMAREIKTALAQIEEATAPSPPVEDSGDAEGSSSDPC